MCSDQSHRTERWRERLPGLLMLGSPFLAVAWTACGIVMNSYFRRFGWNILDPFVFLVLLNATIASLGAALGGFLSSKTIRRQVRETIVAGVLGLWLYLMWGAMLFVVIVIVRTSIILLFG